MLTLVRTRINHMRAGTICLLTLTLCACPLFRGDSFVIWGDEAEYVAYIDYYNSLDDGNRAEFRYVPQIFPEHISARDAPDIIIAKHISYRDAKRAMRAIPQSLIADNGNENRFYRTLFHVGTIRNSQRVIPLSFNIPIVVFNRNDDVGFTDEPSVTLDQIKGAAEQMNTYTEEVLSRVGFSPRWDSRFLYLGTKAFGANYREDRQGNTRWDEGKVFESLQYFNSWNSEIDSEELEQFITKYAQQPLHNRLTEGRIGFFMSDVVEYSTLEDNRFDFRPISDTQGIFVDEDMTFIGMHKNGANSTQARDFVRWILEEETQRMLIAHTDRYDIDIFGLANGLSTLSNISVRVIPQYHPWLIGSTPDVFTAPLSQQLPKYWHRIRAEVVTGWLQNFLTGVYQESLESEMIKWQKREGSQ